MSDITSVSKLLEAIQSTGFFNQPHDHVRVWFRGHGDVEWRLEPGVYRRDFAPDETTRQRKERHLTQDFQALGAPLLRGVTSDVDIYFIQQHYRMPTRLLDWSLNPLAGLFFALHPFDASTDGTFFIIDAYQLAGQRGFCTSRADEVRRAVRTIFEWADVDEKGNSLWPNQVLAIRPFNIDPRLEAQRGCFTFHPPAHNAIDVASPALKAFKIPAEAKAKLKTELDMLGFDEFTTYGGLDKLAERLKRVKYF